MRNIKGIAALIAIAALAGCGSGGGGGEGGNAVGSAPFIGTAPAAAPNVLTVTVDGGPAGLTIVNGLYASVTVCVPGTSQCQSIDHVLVDTGSSGLRIIASVLSSAVSLPAQTDAGGNAMAECAAFLDGITWGSIRLADVRLSSEVASALPIQLIGDPAFPSVPASCSGRGPTTKNTVQTLSANGILGIGPFVEDCGPGCAQGAVSGTYYTCPQGQCQPVAASLAQQVSNPVARLPVNNNGVIIELPALPPSGATGVIGGLTLGIGTAGNNALGNAVKFDLDSSGNLRTVYKSRAMTAFVDSGSNAYFFTDPAIPRCSPGSRAPTFFCPPAPLALSATIQGATNGQSQTIGFSVANANDLVSSAPGLKAFDNLGGPSIGTSSFDFGLPFFYGRRVFTAIEGRNSPGGTGPYIAF